MILWFCWPILIVHRIPLSDGKHQSAHSEWLQVPIEYALLYCRNTMLTHAAAGRNSMKTVFLSIFSCHNKCHNFCCQQRHKQTTRLKSHDIFFFFFLLNFLGFNILEMAGMHRKLLNDLLFPVQTWLGPHLIQQQEHWITSHLTTKIMSIFKMYTWCTNNGLVYSGCFNEIE